MGTRCACQMLRVGVSMSQVFFKGRLNGVQRNKMKGLFDMMYTPKELSGELDMKIDQIYEVYIPLGCPHDRDDKNRILINGKAFASWYIENYKKAKLEEDETFCLTCRKGVKIYRPKNKFGRKISYIVSTCPNCGRKLVKIINNKRQRT
jgi:hypothetical protein